MMKSINGLLWGLQRGGSSFWRYCIFGNIVYPLTKISGLLLYPLRPSRSYSAISTQSSSHWWIDSSGPDSSVPIMQSFFLSTNYCGSLSKWAGTVPPLHFELVQMIGNPYFYLWCDSGSSDAFSKMSTTFKLSPCGFWRLWGQSGDCWLVSLPLPLSIFQLTFIC